MKHIVALMFGYFIATLAVVAGPSTSQAFQMRLVLDRPSSQTDEMTLVRKHQDADQKEVLFVSKTVLLDQSDVESAEVVTNVSENPADIDKLLRAKGFKPAQTDSIRINIAFTSEGAKRFADITRQNFGKRLAIVIDGRLYSAPRIMSEISGGKAAITGGFTPQEARAIVAKITESLQKR